MNVKEISAESGDAIKPGRNVVVRFPLQTIRVFAGDLLRRAIQDPRGAVVELQKLVGFRYRTYDSSAYWRSRAGHGQGQTRVLWTNDEYNRLYRQRQMTIIQRVVSGLPSDARVLDIGCGIGVVAEMLLSCNPSLSIDAVDFEEMIEIAKCERPSPRITYIASAAESYRQSARIYDLVLSSGCFSSIRRLDALKAAITNCADMTKHGGVILMIDPFHRWRYLARARYSSSNVITLMSTLGFSCVEKSGVLFWPFRLQLASSDLRGEELERLFEQGEYLRSFMGAHFWADYKILVFKKDGATRDISSQEC